MSLRFPITDIAAVLEHERNEMKSVEAITTDDVSTTSDEEIVEIPDRYKRIRSALYLTGASLTIAGAAIEVNREEGFSWEIPIGISIMAGTFIYDKYLHKSNKE